jgi:ubiquinone/menaquinone biosynthesis C-methylase UbiE
MHIQTTQCVQSFLAAEPLNGNDGTSTIITFKVSRRTLALEANSYYFGHETWAKGYLRACHQYKDFKERRHTLMGSWEDKIVVDVGCGPGNVYRSLQKHCGTPRLLIGIDVAKGGLEMAQALGYVPVLADAQQLPFVSGFADIVTANATLHHCDDMEQVLREAARLVRPGGKLVIDHEPQKTMFNDNWIAKLIWNARLPLYLWMKRGGHTTAEEQYWSTATEAHHKPGDGVTPDLFYRVLEPMGFQVRLYPHNTRVGSEITQGKQGQGPWKVRLAQRLTGVNPNSASGAMMLMCVATRTASLR